MPLSTVKTVTFIEEIPTDGHAPMKFLCEDGAVYFCKFRKSFDIRELDLLGYELICSYLLESQRIPTPNIAIVELQEGSFDPKSLGENRRYARPGVHCFGSREVENADLVRDTETLSNKHDFNRLENPHDLVRIAIFDLWVQNIDRGKPLGNEGHNYNLLIRPYGGMRQFVAFDNAFAFGGTNLLRVINPAIPFYPAQSLISSPYFRSVVKHIPIVERLEIANTFLPLCCVTVTDTIRAAFRDLPPSWQIPPTLEQRLVTFLLDATRNDLIREAVESSLHSI